MSEQPEPENKVKQSINSKETASEVEITNQASIAKKSSLFDSFAQTGKIFADKALGSGVRAAKQTQKLLEQATQTTGGIVNYMKAAGLALLRNVPFAGAAIATSSNAAMSYSLGYAACRFYEAKLDESVSLASKATLANLKAESENYLETAIAQQVIMDKILVHILL